MERTNLAPLTLEGHFLLHQLFRVPPSPEEEGERVAHRKRTEALAELLKSWADLGDDGWSGLYRVVGGSADYMLVHFRPTLEALGEVEVDLRRHPASQDLVPVGDYVSVVELSLYHVTVLLLDEAREQGVEPGSGEWEEMVRERLAAERKGRYAQERLRPVQPDDMPHICFYPMDKRRQPGENWYMLPVRERAALMQEHGTTGRRYAGRVSQVISASVGFDDWEWGVTLFAADPIEFKALITEMRYDEVSALYAEFGSFWVGHRVPTERIADELGP